METTETSLPTLAPSTPAARTPSRLLRRDQVLAPRGSVDGRPVIALDRFYFTNNFAALTFAISMDRRFDEARLGKSFTAALACTPILRSEIVAAEDRRSGGETLRFADLPRERWPRLRYVAVASDALVDELAQKQLDAWSTSTDQTYPLLIQLVQGPTRACLLGATPHQFADGIGLASFISKILTYERVPRPLWRLLHFFSPREVPLHRELLLGERSKDVDASGAVLRSKRLDDANLRLEPVSPGEGAAASGRCVYYRQLTVPPSALRAAMKAIRLERSTMTAQCSALATKLMARLVEAGEARRTGDQLLISIPVEARGLAAGSRLKRHLAFPVVANYASAFYCQIPLQAAASQPLTELARTVRSFVATSCEPVAVDRDLCCLAEYGATDKDRLHQYIGASSIYVRWWQTRAIGARNLRMAAAIQFGGFPHVWLYVVTASGQCTLTVDIDLPIGGLTTDDVVAHLLEAGRGSALAPILEATLGAR